MIRYVLTTGSRVVPFIACEKCKAPLHYAKPRKGKLLKGSKPGMAFYALDGEVHFYCKNIGGKGCDPGRTGDDQGWAELDEMVLHLIRNSHIDIDDAEERGRLLDMI